MLALQPQRINDLRRARGLGRPKLAKLSGLTERQVARLEGALPWKGVFTEDMLLRLAHALQVQPATLLGDQPLTEADLDVVPQTRCCSHC